MNQPGAQVFRDSPEAKPTATIQAFGGKWKTVAMGDDEVGIDRRKPLAPLSLAALVCPFSSGSYDRVVPMAANGRTFQTITAQPGDQVNWIIPPVEWIAENPEGWSR